MSTVPATVTLCSFPRDSVPETPRGCSYMTVKAFLRSRNLRFYELVNCCFRRYAFSVIRDRGSEEAGSRAAGEVLQNWTQTMKKEKKD